MILKLKLLMIGWLRVYIFKDNTPLKNITIQQEEVAAVHGQLKKTFCN